MFLEVEELGRRELWERNVMLITIHNLEASMGLHSYDLSMNHMGDLVRDARFGDKRHGFEYSFSCLSTKKNRSQI